MSNKYQSHMELIQSYLFSVTRVSLTLYEQRIVTKIVECAQKRVQGLSMSQHKCKLSHHYDNVRIELPVRYVLGEQSHHYEYVYEAAKSLMSRKFEYYDSDTRTWYSSPLIYNVSVKQRGGIVSFYVARALFDSIFDFSHGYKAYDLATAMSLPNPAAVRFYALFAAQDKPITYDIDALKKMFCVESKYRQTADFIKRVIEPARLALDEKGCTSFTFAKVKRGQKIIKLTFYPIKRFIESDLVQIKSKSEAVMRQACVYVLQDEGMFTHRELGSHSRLLTQFAHVPDAHNVLSHICHKSARSTIRNPKGYIIDEMRREVNAIKRNLLKQQQQ